MKIINRNYKGRVTSDISKLKFPIGKPPQLVFKKNYSTLIVFPTGNCRLMGRASQIPRFPVKFEILGLQSQTLTLQLSSDVNLPALHALFAKTSKYEPEIFPAVRLHEYNPLCVNVFSSGKVVILGLKEDYCDIVIDIYKDLNFYCLLSTLI